MSVKFAAPSYGERCLIRRHRLGLTQSKAAKQFKLPVHVYRQLENNNEVNGSSLPPVVIGALQAHERCLLMRRRCGMTQAQVAKKLGCSRYWLGLQELGKVPCDDLTWFWEQ